MFVRHVDTGLRTFTTGWIQLQRDGEFLLAHSLLC